MTLGTVAEPAMTAPDSSLDPDDTAQEDINAEIEADLLESLLEGGYQERMSANHQKRVIRKKAANFKIVNGEIIIRKSGGEKKRYNYGLG